MSARNSVLLCCVSLLACEKTPEAPALQAGPTWQSRAGIVAVDVSPDGRTLLLGELLSESTLWYSPWNRSATLARVPGTLLAARFITGDRVLLATNEGGVAVYAADSGKELQRTKLALGQVSRRAEGSDSGRFVAFDSSIYDLTAGRLAAQVPQLAAQSALGFAGDRAAWMAGFHDARLSVLGMNGEPQRDWRAPDKIVSAAMSSDGRYLASGTTDGVVIWRADRTEPHCQHSTRARVTFLRFAHAADWLAFTADARLSIVNAADCSERATLELHQAASALDIDAELVAVGDTDGYVYVWDRKRNALAAVARSLPHAVNALRVHAGTRAVLAVSTSSNGSDAKYLTIPAK